MWATGGFPRGRRHGCMMQRNPARTMQYGGNAAPASESRSSICIETLAAGPRREPGGSGPASARPLEQRGVQRLVLGGHPISLVPGEREIMAVPAAA